MSRQSWEEALAWTVSDGSTIASSSTETIIFPDITIPANYLADGRALRIKAYGRWGATATPNAIFSVRWGGVAGTVICQSGSIVLSAQAAALWEMDVDIVTRTNGSTGTVFATGSICLYTGTVPTMGTVTNYGVKAPMCSGGTSTPAAVTVNLAADTALSLTVKYSASAAQNTLTGHNYVLESLQ